MYCPSRDRVVVVVVLRVVAAETVVKSSTVVVSALRAVIGTEGSVELVAKIRCTFKPVSSSIIFISLFSGMFRGDVCGIPDISLG